MKIKYLTFFSTSNFVMLYKCANFAFESNILKKAVLWENQ